MRFLRIVSNTGEPSAPRDPTRFAQAKQAINDEIASGKLIAIGAIGKRATGAARVASKGGEITVEDPPAGEGGWMAGGGYALFEAASKDDAIAQAKLTLDIMGDGVIELIEVSEMYPRPTR